MMNAVIADTDYKQPIYSIEFNIYGTGAVIKLNDIPVHVNEATGQTSAEKPVPESIVDGKNILAIKTFPLEEDGGKYQPGAYAEAVLSIREKDAPLNQNKPLLQIKVNPTESEEKIFYGTIRETGDSEPKLLSHSEKSLVAGRAVNISSPFPRWAWQDGQKIEKTKDEFISLVKKYKEVWEALKSENMTRIKSFYDPAAKEFAKAYHYDDISQGHKIMNTGGMIEESDWVLGDINKFLKKRKYTIKVYANGKMAEVVDTQDYKSPIMYLNPKTRLISFQKFGFYKNQKGEWVMIR
ncbi:MAG: hypothetical protein OEY52_08505 [Gammaproteobacteria bacterium]|nr:hypothetical protein [Gammaproteobacteria bacterium]